jgi:hypothetical protein
MLLLLFILAHFNHPSIFGCILHGAGTAMSNNLRGFIINERHDYPDTTTTTTT